MRAAPLDRRRFLSAAGRLAASGLLGGAFGGTVLAGCSREDSARYTEADVARLARQRERERERSGRGPFGPQRYRGYRGLAALPWFELDADGRLRCVADDLPRAIDFHAHLGMSVLFEPRLDLRARTERVKHLLDCDATQPGCPLDLDVYINANFSEEDLATLRRTTLTQGLWGNPIVRTHTVPNLLEEMEAMRVERAVLLPIVLGLPFGDDLEGRWRAAVEAEGVGDRLHVGASVEPGDPGAVARLEAQAARGARVLKLHPTVQAFYPDAPELMTIYEAAERLGLVVFFHGGRAGIEPEARRRYAMPRHYEEAFARFPGLRFVVGHGGARDGEAMLDLAVRFENVWLGLHGQGVTRLDDMIRRTGGERLVFGTDWPFYHLAATLAKVLIVTDSADRRRLRPALLRGNAEALLAGA